MKAKKLTDRGIKVLKASLAIDHWQKGRERIEAEDLLMFVLGVDEDPPGDQEVRKKDAERFDQLIDRRATGEPLPFIKGYTVFRDLEILAAPGVFVPRDSSEFLAEQAIVRLRKRKRPVHVDLATGGGTIALAVADEVPKAAVYGADLAADAVKLSRKNAKRLGLKATFAQGDLFDGLPKELHGKVDVITLHPPYVAKGELKDLPDEVRDWEPEHTLTDQSHDGLGLITKTVQESPAWLCKNGWLLVEVSPDRARDVVRVFKAGGFREAKSTKGGDLPVTRVIVARRPA